MSKMIIICTSALIVLNAHVVAQSPGEVVGLTFYDQQSIGSGGNRIAVCGDGSIYVCWMRLPNWPYPLYPRHVYFNWRSPDGNWSFGYEGAPVSTASGSGFPDLDIIHGNRGAFAYHLFGASPYVILAIDIDPPGIGFFDYYDPPDEIYPQEPDSSGRLYWPHIAVDRNDNIHIVETENMPVDDNLLRMGYTRSIDYGTTWVEPQVVDTVTAVSGVIDASPVSDRVVICYASATDTTSTAQNDVYYIDSNDGLNWDFQNDRVNITNYGDDPDSLGAQSNVDVIFDYDNYIHIVWIELPLSPPGESHHQTDIRHFSEETGEITTAAYGLIDTVWFDNINLGVDQARPPAIFLTYARYLVFDLSAGGYPNGDIYTTYSDNGGSNWNEPIALTRTSSPGCHPGECLSEDWCTLADVVDDYLHFTYIFDRDAGSIMRNEGSTTENPVMYLAYPNPLLTIKDDANRPAAFSLDQNCPNPFNARTTISFELKKPADVKLEIFDITGARVATLVDEYLPAGPHDVIWNAQDVASGTYIYRLTAAGNSYSRRAVLLK